MATRPHGLATALLVLLAASSAGADRMEKLPKELEGVTLVEKSAAQIPLGATFTNERGQSIALRDLFGSKPVILTFNYSNCPMLCSLQIDGLVDSMLNMDWKVGNEFEVITISLDPNEKTVRARETKDRYLDRYDHPDADLGWHFLTGTEEQIRSVADSVGFGYRYHPGRKEYLHPAVLTFVSPNGKVSGYMAGLEYDPVKVGDRLYVARLGQISEPFAEFLLSCYHYEAGKGNGAIVQKIMSAGAFVFVLGLMGAFAVFRFKRSHNLVHTHQVGSSEDHV